MSQQVQDWTDFEWFVVNWPATQVIATLKAAAAEIEKISGVYLGIRTTDKKSIIIEKIVRYLRTMNSANDLENYRRIRQRMEEVGKPYVAHRSNTHVPGQPVQTPTFGGIPAGPSRAGHAASSPYPAYDPPGGYRAPGQAGPSRAGGWSSAMGVNNAYTGRAPGQVHVLQDWKASPLWKPLVAVTGMEALPDMNPNEAAHSRKTKHQTFYLSKDVADKLQASKSNPNQAPHYSLRIFCTSNEHYGPSGYYPGRAIVINKNLPIEYPNSPDVLFDNSPVPFRERGLRGKAGSSPPFDLIKTPTHFIPNSTRLYNLVFGHTGPTTGKKKEIVKKFYFQVVLAEMTTKDELLAKLLALKPCSIDEALADARARADDEDIVAGDTRMTLKDPLSYMRITQPIRSKLCTHIQCFDAKWWIESNAQHPQFLCPLCSKALKVEDLIVDGYFASILDAVPDSVEEVIVDSDFKWRSEDGKFTSDGPTQKAAESLPTPVSEPKPDSSRAPSAAPSAVTAGKRKAIEILSSDDDEDQPLSKTAHTANRTPGPSVPPPNTGGVIDLTLDDSDEEDENETFFPPPGTGTGRDAVDSTRQPIPPIKVQEADSGARLHGDLLRVLSPPLPRPAYSYRPPPPLPRPHLPETFALGMDDFDLGGALYPDLRSPVEDRNTNRSGSSSKGPQMGTWDRSTPNGHRPPPPPPGPAPIDRWDPDGRRSRRPTTPYNDWLTYDEQLQNGDRHYPHSDAAHSPSALSEPANKTQDPSREHDPALVSAVELNSAWLAAIRADAPESRLLSEQLCPGPSSSAAPDPRGAGENTAVSRQAGSERDQNTVSPSPALETGVNAAIDKPRAISILSRPPIPSFRPPSGGSPSGHHQARLSTNSGAESTSNAYAPLSPALNTRLPAATALGTTAYLPTFGSSFADIIFTPALQHGPNAGISGIPAGGGGGPARRAQGIATDGNGSMDSVELTL